MFGAQPLSELMLVGTFDGLIYLHMQASLGLNEYITINFKLFNESMKWNTYFIKASHAQ